MLFHKVITIAVLLTLWPLLVSTAHAEHPSRIHRAIQNEYDRMDAAMAKKDLEAFFSHFAPDYTSFDASGKKISKAGNRQILEQLCSHVKSITIISRVKHLVQIGSRVTVRVNREMTMMIINPRTQQLIKAVSTTEYLDGWIQKRNSYWLLRTNNRISSSQIVSAPLPVQPGRQPGSEMKSQ